MLEKHYSVSRERFGNSNVDETISEINVHVREKITILGIFPIPYSRTRRGRRRSRFLRVALFRNLLNEIFNIFSDGFPNVSANTLFKRFNSFTFYTNSKYLCLTF